MGEVRLTPKVDGLLVESYDTTVTLRPQSTSGAWQVMDIGGEEWPFEARVLVRRKPLPPPVPRKRWWRRG